MSLIDNGIEEVVAFELPAGIWADGRIFSCPKVVLVKWRSSFSDKFHQVYVDGRYAGVTIDNAQRQMLVQIPTNLARGVRIEVFAVDPDQSNIDFSGEYKNFLSGSGRVKISLLRDQKLAVGSTVQIYFDNGSGQIDYSNPLNKLPIHLWPYWQDKTGFGMSCFGKSDFGYDGAAAIGFGKGGFGYGSFGFDADIIEWISKPLATGIYKFAAKVIDDSGRESAASETGEVVVISDAKPVEEISVDSFDKNTNELVLSIF